MIRPRKIIMDKLRGNDVKREGLRQNDFFFLMPAVLCFYENEKNIFRFKNHELLFRLFEQMWI